MPDNPYDFGYGSLSTYGSDSNSFMGKLLDLWNLIEQSAQSIQRAGGRGSKRDITVEPVDYPQTPEEKKSSKEDLMRSIMEKARKQSSPSWAGEDQGPPQVGTRTYELSFPEDEKAPARGTFSDKVAEKAWEPSPEDILYSLYNAIKPEARWERFGAPGEESLHGYHHVLPQREDMAAKQIAADLLSSMLKEKTSQQVASSNTELARAQIEAAARKSEWDRQKDVVGMNMDRMNYVRNEVKLYDDRIKSITSSPTSLVTSAQLDQMNFALSNYQNALLSGDEKAIAQWKEILDKALSSLSTAEVGPYSERYLFGREQIRGR